MASIEPPASDPALGLDDSPQGGSEQQEKDHGETNGRPSGWRRVIQDFIPSWFAVTMGTGVVSVLLFSMPYNGVWLYYLSLIVFCLNVFLFVTFTVITLLRYILYPTIWMTMLRHPTQSLFVGCFPIALCTIINMIVYTCVPAWGPWVIDLAWALWWFDAVVSVTTCYCLPFVIMKFHEVELSTMTATWLLPVVAPVVCAATGGLVAHVLPDPQHALWTMVVSYVLWGSGMSLAMVVLVIYFHRLTVHHLPPREVIVSVFLPLGPVGSGGFAIMQLGRVALKIFPDTHTLPATTGNAGEILYVGGWLIGIVMWGFGLVWLFFAVASITRSRFPFNMGWWGFTFPLGVYTTSTTMLAVIMPSVFFKVLGSIFSTLVILLWIMVAYGTIRKVWMGQLLVAPCLKDLDARAKSKLNHHV